MDKNEAKLLPFTTDELNSSEELYEKPVYETTIQFEIRPPTGKLTKIFKSRTYNQILSTI